MSRDRLQARLRADVADVRVRLEEAVLRTDALLAAGQPERAAEVLGEQETLLAELHDTLASSVAAAAVEAAAEAVLAGSPEGDELFASGASEGAPDDRGRDRTVRPLRRQLRATASALVSAAAAIAFALTASSPPSPSTLAAADADARDAGTPSPADAPTRGITAAEDAGTERAIGPNELEIRRLFSSESPSPVASSPAARLGAGLANLQDLVDGLIASVVRAASDLTPSVLPSGPATELVDEPVLPRPRHDAEAGTADEAPAAPDEQPAPAEPDAPRPSEAPADEADPEDGDATEPTLPVPSSLGDSDLGVAD